MAKLQELTFWDPMRAASTYMRNGASDKVSRNEEDIQLRSSLRAKSIHDRRLKLRQLLQEQTLDPIQRIVSSSRIIIIEGISGSGKDTFQKRLKDQIRNREIYEYSEGEVLQSWTHLPIRGICRLQLKFMKLFLKHMNSVLKKNPDAVFLLNRFHLSVYVAAVLKQPKLEREYNECLEILRKLPVHVFILHVDDAEIEQRTVHPERSDAWRRFQQQIIRTEGFRGRLERYSSQQKLILQLAEKQQIQYSIVRLPMYPALEAEWVGAPTTDRNSWHLKAVSDRY